MRGLKRKPSSPRLAALLLAIVLFLFGGYTGQAMPGSAQAQAASVATACSKTPSSPSGPDYSNRDLSGMNFNRMDLRNANFSGATLKGTVFIGANLSGADFSNARLSMRNDLDLGETRVNCVQQRFGEKRVLRDGGHRRVAARAAVRRCGAGSAGGGAAQAARRGGECAAEGLSNIEHGRSVRPACCRVTAGLLPDDYSGGSVITFSDVANESKNVVG